MKKTKLLAILLALACLLALAGCGASSPKDAAVSAPAAEPAAPEIYNMSSETPAADSELSFTASEPAGQEDSEPADDAEGQTELAEKIIYTASVAIESTDFDAAAASLDALTKQFGGFYESSSVSGNTQYLEDGTSIVVNRRGYYTVRVPADSFEAFLERAKTPGALGNVVSSSSNARNVTAEYTDYEVRLKSLNTQYDALIELMSKAEDIESVIALETRISEVLYEIESTENTLRNYDRKISYSTVELTLEEVEIYTPTVPVQRTFGERVKDAFSGMWSNFGRACRNFVVGFIYALPTIIILAAILVGLFFAARAVLRGRRRKKAAKKAASEAPAVKKEDENK